MAMTTVAVVHKHMHQRARQKQQAGHRTQEVSAVLAQQKESGGSTEHHPAHEGCTGNAKIAAFLMSRCSDLAVHRDRDSFENLLD